MKKLGFLTTVALASVAFGTLHASALSGKFSMSGDIAVTTSMITWTSDVAPNIADMFTLSLGQGSFTTENGQNGVNNLNIATEPVGSVFPPVPFITFDVATGMPVLDINFIAAGTGGSAGCSAAPAVTTPPQTCTPANPGGSPFTFTNNPPPSSIQSSGNFVFTGVTSDGLSTWVADFNTSFNAPFQTVLAAFAPGGSGVVTDSYQATVTVTPNPTTPEPNTLVLLGAGLLLVGFGASRFKARA